MLLVVSHEGRGVYDCLSGQRVALDKNEDIWPDHDKDANTFSGVGPLLGVRIKTHGLYGGDGLVKQNHDGDRLTMHEDELWLEPVRGERELVLDLSKSEVRAHGFSPTGKSFVVGTSTDLAIWTDGSTEDSLYVRVDRLLGKEWDPFGLDEGRDANDEYHGYVSGIVALLTQNAGIEEIASHLTEIATKRMGLPLDRSAYIRNIATKLKGLMTSAAQN